MPQTDRGPATIAPDTLPVDDSIPIIDDPITMPNAPPMADVPATDVPQTALPDDDGGFPWWILGILVIVVIAGTVLYRRRNSGSTRPAPVAEPVIRQPTIKPRPIAKPRERRVPPPPEPIMPIGQLADQTSEPLAPPAPPTSPFGLTAPVLTPSMGKKKTAPKSAPKPAEPQRVKVDFKPVSVRLSAEGLAVGYELSMGCVSEKPISDVSTWLTLRNADHVMAKIDTNTTSPEMYLASLSKGQSKLHRGELRLDRDHFKAVPMDGQDMLVPIIDLMGQYTDADGVVHEKHLAMIIGNEHTPQKPQVAPFPLDQEIKTFTNFGLRPVDLPEMPEAA